MSVIYAELELRVDEYEEALRDFTARNDDAYWSRFARASRGSWHDFTQWWIARRWIVPRNPSRR
jgi:hypothetical protein